MKSCMNLLADLSNSSSIGQTTMKSALSGVGGGDSPACSGGGDSPACPGGGDSPACPRGPGGGASWVGDSVCVARSVLSGGTS